MQSVVDVLCEMDRLKSIYRKSFLSDGSRRENSAEHSWHMALALMVLEEYLPDGVDTEHMLRMALVHDLCEIGAGDVPIYSPQRGSQDRAEAEYMQYFRETFGEFGKTAQELWQEYEAQQSLESQWVRLADRIMPFILNMATQGKAWREDGIRRSQVLEINQPVKNVCPEIYRWIEQEVDRAVSRGWLVNQ